MILWTMQPIEVWNIIQDTGGFHCDPAKRLITVMIVMIYFTIHHYGKPSIACIISLDQLDLMPHIIKFVH